MGVRTQVFQMLDDTHVLVVDDSKQRELLIQMFTALSANVHHAETQMQAVGMYFRLFRQRCIPRAVVCDWYLNPPDSAEHQFMKKYMSDEVQRATTCVVLLENILDLEPNAFISIYTEAVDEAREQILRRGWNVTVYDKKTLPVVEFVSRIAEHQTIAQQRVERSQIAHHLRDLQTKMESGLHPVIKYPKKQ